MSVYEEETRKMEAMVQSTMGTDQTRAVSVVSAISSLIPNTRVCCRLTAEPIFCPQRKRLAVILKCEDGCKASMAKIRKRLEELVQKAKVSALRLFYPILSS